MTISFDKGPNAPENAKFSVGIPKVRPMPPKAETNSNTITNDQSNSLLGDGFSSRIRKRLNHGALSSSIIFVRSMMQMRKIAQTSHQISNATCRRRCQPKYCPIRWVLGTFSERSGSSSSSSGPASNTPRLCSSYLHNGERQHPSSVKQSAVELTRS